MNVDEWALMNVDEWALMNVDDRFKSLPEVSLRLFLS